MNVVGEVEGRDCILADDMIDTAGTVTEAARALKALGAQRRLRLRHARAVQRAGGRAAQRAPITEVAVTDTIAIPPERRFERLTCCRWASC